MATEKGIVIKIESGTAWVRTLPSEACSGCSSCGTCNAQREDAEVEVINEVGAQIGDRILIDIKTSAYLKATFLLYVFPIIGLTAGAMLGVQFAAHYAYDASACSAAFGFGAFFMTVFVVRIVGNRMGREQAYRPKIVKILLPMAPVTVDMRDRCPV